MKRNHRELSHEDLSNASGGAALGKALKAGKGLVGKAVKWVGTHKKIVAGGAAAVTLGPSFAKGVKEGASQ